MAFLSDPNVNPGVAEAAVMELQETAAARHVELHIHYAGTDSEIVTAFTTLAQLWVRIQVRC